MSRVMGRTDDMLIIRGVNVFPSADRAVLFEIEGVEPHYQIVVDRKGALDEATVLVEVSESIFFDEMKRQTELKETIKKRLASELGDLGRGQARRQEDPRAVRGQSEARHRQPEVLAAAPRHGGRPVRDARLRPAALDTRARDPP